MSIPCRLYTLLIEFSVFEFHKEFLLSIFIGFILMDFFTISKHLIQYHDPKYGFLAFKFSKEVSEFVCLFSLFALGFKALLYSPFFKCFLQFSYYNLRRNSRKFKKDFCSEKTLDSNFVRLKDLADESTEKSDCHRKISREMDKEYNNDEFNEYMEDDDECGSVDEDESRGAEDDEYDVSRLRKLVKMERGRANAATAELLKERAANSTAAEEAMAMIVRLQNEKSSIEMESIQYRRLAEAKQVHDHQVIQSLEWLLWRNDTEINSMQQEMNRLLESDDDDDLGVENVFSTSIFHHSEFV